MKRILISFTGFCLQWGGIIMLVAYANQSYEIVRIPRTAEGISITSWLLVNFLQGCAAVNSYLGGNKKLAIGFGAAFVGSVSITLVTAYFRATL